MTSTQGRSFLDSEVHLHFARYGVGLQEWTPVGIIGHHGISEHVDMNDADFIDDEQNVVRSAHSTCVVAWDFGCTALRFFQRALLWPCTGCFKRWTAWG